MKTYIALAATALTIVTLTSCKNAADNYDDLHSTQQNNLTVGKVQREIRKGMSGAEVAESLGSPNIVTKDANDKETWVYDKIATEASYSTSQNSIFLIIAGISNQSGAAATSQRTLTVVIKFDPTSKVESFTYHSSKF